MLRRWAYLVVVSSLVLPVALPGVARAESLGKEFDLESFGEDGREPRPSVWEGMPLQDVSRGDGVADRRFYISGMLGPSFANFGANSAPQAVSTDDTLLAAGGAIGIALERRNGRLRIETEGMGRSTYFGPAESFGGLTVGLLTASNWSVMESVWRDVMLTDRFGVYGGGGIGAGGYRWGVGTRGWANEAEYYPKPASAFAWQAGGGLIYEFTDRLTLDVGYRYFQISPVPIQGTDLNFSASELLFSLRLYEPFRRWTR
ncbi:MAG: outer membrane protein [Planctomycetia bacterium]